MLCHVLRHVPRCGLCRAPYRIPCHISRRSIRIVMPIALCIASGVPLRAASHIVVSTSPHTLSHATSDVARSIAFVVIHRVGHVKSHGRVFIANRVAFSYSGFMRPLPSFVLPIPLQTMGRPMFPTTTYHPLRCLSCPSPHFASPTLSRPLSRPVSYLVLCLVVPFVSRFVSLCDIAFA